jgi:hypothetical protein
MQLNPKQIKVGRKWLNDSFPGERESDRDALSISAPQIESEIRRQYPGGIDRFLAAGGLSFSGADASD